jgi:alkanesulfonate monooxygenase SsuD/methylene tetrahydromethanopterin reductase-like flavin-dependent oxidoreductase (luciferase family)
MFEGEFDAIPAAGIAPLPFQRPIPLWLGAGDSDAALRRVGRLADGYLSHGAAEEDGRMSHHVGVIRDAARDAGRDPASIGLQGLIPVVGKDRDEILATARRWQQIGATHLTIDPRSVSLHVNRELSMADKVHLRRSATQQLIDETSRAQRILADL